MRTNKGSSRYKAASLTLFLAMMTGAAYAVSPETGTSGAVSFAVNLREWFVLEVQTPDIHVESSGVAGAGVTTTMSPDGIPARIKALAVVAHNQAVELKVQVFGDLVGPSGETLPLSEVSWVGSGEGFLSGRFTPGEPPSWPAGWDRAFMREPFSISRPVRMKRARNTSSASFTA